MADPRETVTAGCNDHCGCPSPCPGGAACRCATTEGGAAGSGEMEHKKCPCGEHCSCNPCTCGENVSSGAGRPRCTCGPGCTCVTCAA